MEEDQAVHNIKFSTKSKEPLIVAWMYDEQDALDTIVEELESNVRRALDLKVGDSFVIKNKNNAILNMKGIARSIQQGKAGRCSEVVEGNLLLQLEVNKGKPTRQGSGGSTRTDGGSSSKKLAIDPAVHKTLKSETKGYRQYLARYMVDEKPEKEIDDPDQPGQKKMVPDYDMYKLRGMLVYFADSDHVWAPVVELAIKTMLAKYHQHGVTEAYIKTVWGKEVASLSRGFLNTYMANEGALKGKGTTFSPNAVTSMLNETEQWEKDYKVMYEQRRQDRPPMPAMLMVMAKQLGIGGPLKVKEAVKGPAPQELKQKSTDLQEPLQSEMDSHELGLGQLDSSPASDSNDGKASDRPRRNARRGSSSGAAGAKDGAAAAVAAGGMAMPTEPSSTEKKLSAARDAYAGAAAVLLKANISPGTIKGILGEAFQGIDPPSDLNEPPSFDFKALRQKDNRLLPLHKTEDQRLAAKRGRNDEAGEAARSTKRNKKAVAAAGAEEEGEAGLGQSAAGKRARGGKGGRGKSGKGGRVTSGVGGRGSKKGKHVDEEEEEGIDDLTSSSCAGSDDE